MLIVFRKIKPEPRIQKIFYTKKIDEITEKSLRFYETKTVKKDKKYKSVEEEVDELLTKLENKNF